MPGRRSCCCRPLLAAAADYDNSNGLRTSLDWASAHDTAFPLLAASLLVFQASAVIAAASHGTCQPMAARTAACAALLRCARSSWRLQKEKCTHCCAKVSRCGEVEKQSCSSRG